MHIFGLFFFNWSRILAELFKILKDMLLKCRTQYVSKFGKLSIGYRTGKGQFSFQSQRKAMAKNVTVTSVGQIHSWFYEHICLFSHSVVSDSLRTHGLQHDRLPCPSSSPGSCSNSCPLSQWCHPIISSSVVPFSSCLQSFPESGSFPMSQFFASSGQSTGVSASASVLPMNIQGWFLLGLTGLISLLPKGLSRVFSNTTVLNCEL